MGWTHDYSEVARNRRSAIALNSRERGGPQDPGHEGPAQGMGIPHILRRRARWVSARLRHTRD
ncbi:hypothetical protein [Streptomyces longisporoflavus]|uniref:Uncharacterized protein n=1 Tax=Streptomyces longisporoflavus TaxID=28044 RepID=A0ABW7QXN3_9ACTN|nr:hypothetical protein [Streptomyces longisporoflavus]